MPMFKFDFDLDAWIQDLEIPADSLEEAKEKLCKMSVADLIDYGYVKDFNIKDLDYEIVKDDEEDEDD
jgi:hypothetical protein